MNYQCLKIDNLDNGIRKIVLSRPAELNALNQQLLTELKHCIEDCKKDSLIKAVLLTGDGKAFCAGADINQLLPLDQQQGYEFAKIGQGVFRLIETLSKPVLAAVNGYAFGGGCELSMAAHIRIGSNYAQFGQPEVKLGVIPGYGGTQRLARIVGKGRALELCLTGRFIKAEEAFNYGLISEVVPSDSLLERAVEILTTVMSMGPVAVEKTIQAVDQGFDIPLPDALELEAKLFGESCATEDKTEGVQAFIEKRTANFIGK